MPCMSRFLLPLLLVFSSGVNAVCPEAGDRLRGSYSLHLPEDGMVLRIQQPEEDVIVHILDQQQSLRFSHPGGAGIDHFILLDDSVLSDTIEVCLFARFKHSQPGLVDLEQIPLTAFSDAEVSLLRELTHAAETWGDNNAKAREQALAIYSKLVSQTGSQQFHALSMLLEAMALMRDTHYSAALRRLETLAALNPADPILRYKAYWQRGEAYLRINQPARATPELQQAIDTIEAELRGGDGPARRDLTDIRLLLAESYLTRRDSDSAGQQIELAKEAADSEYRLLGKLYNLIGYQHIVESQRPELSESERRQILGDAIDVMLTGRFFARDAADLKTLGSLENNLGFVYDRLGEYRQALTHYREILDIIDPEEDPLVYRFAFTNLGRLYQYMADYPRSESYYRQAVSLAELSSGGISTSRCPLGTTLRLRGNVQAAMVEHESCLQQAELTGNLSTLVLARFELGEDYLALGDEESAWRHILWAWQQNPQTVSAAMRSRVLRRYADLLQRRGQHAQANSVISEAIAMHGDSLPPVDLIENHAMAMSIARRQSDLEQAETQGLQAISLIEAQYPQLDSERQGPAWGSRTHEIYVELAETYLEEFFSTGDTVALTRAFDITERSRASSLRQQFANQQSATPVDDSIALLAEKNQIEAISRIANEHALIGSDGSAVISLPTNYYHHQDVLSLYRLQGLTSLPLPPSMTLARIQNSLQPQQAVLYYLLTETQGYVFTVTSDSLTVDRVPDVEDTANLVAATRQLLADADAQPYQLLAQLSGRLLGSLATVDGKQELLLVPHGPLHALPFSALPLPGRAQYEPLVSQFSLKLVPSMTAYLMEKSFNQSAGATDIAVIADPVFDASQLTQQLAVLDDLPSQTLRGWSDNLQRLPNTAVEAQKLAELFPDERSILLTGAQASRANLVREDVRDSKVLHIATHGYFNAANEDNVGLGFSVVDENGITDSGFVTLPELFSYRFNNELVVISGCDTAMGRPLAGEGMMGLSRGFIAQGAKHVISTLWPVSDRASADFMAIFYRQLLALDNVAEALQAAQQEMWQNPNYRNPFYWAAYTLTSVSPDQTMHFSNQVGIAEAP